MTGYSKQIELLKEQLAAKDETIKAQKETIQILKDQLAQKKGSKNTV
jgi:hypothetical protein